LCVYQARPIRLETPRPTNVLTASKTGGAFTGLSFNSTAAHKSATPLGGRGGNLQSSGNTGPTNKGGRTVAAVDTFKIGVGASQQASSLVDGATGIIAIVLTILGLLKLVPIQLVAIATIAAGVGLFAQGLAVARGYAKALSGPTADISLSSAGGWALTFLAGVAGVILGILALLGLDSIALVAISAIVLGGSIILRTHEMSALILARAQDPRATPCVNSRWESSYPTPPRSRR
jgi:hypothetical protein